MTSLTLLLAQDNPTDLSTMEAMRGLFSRMDMLNHPDELLTSLAQMPLIMAGIFIVVGMMCILNGYNWHKWVVVILAFMGGIILGNMLSDQLGKSSLIAFAIGALFAIIATPMLKITVALFGGLTGASYVPLSTREFYHRFAASIRTWMGCAPGPGELSGDRSKAGSYPPSARHAQTGAAPGTPPPRRHLGCCCR